MSKKSKVSIWGGWLTNGEGWKRLQVFKAKKKHNNNTTQIKDSTKKTRRSKRTRQYQQLDLKGENIEKTDGEAFGDQMRDKGKDTIRIISQNIGCMPEKASHEKSRKIVEQVRQSGADAWLFQEVGLCWAKVDESNQWTERTKNKGMRMHANFGYNKTELQQSKPIQAGGVAVIATDGLPPRCVSRGVDPLGLGRWAWTRIEGTGGFHTRLVSVYRPCVPSSQGTGTVYEQHRRRFGMVNREP
jgi:hypothetical protein